MVPLHVGFGSPFPPTTQSADIKMELGSPVGCTPDTQLAAPIPACYVTNYLLTLSPSIPCPLFSNTLYSVSPNTTQTSMIHESCFNMKKYPADIGTADMFPTLELEPDLMERREYWGSQMEDR